MKRLAEVPSRSRRWGVTLMELAASLAVLASIIALVGQSFRLSAVHRIDIERRQLALQEAANCLERLKLVPLEELTPARLQQEALSPAAQRTLPSGALAARLSDDDRLAPAKRLQAEVVWKTGAGSIDLRAGLVAIRFPAAKGK